MLEHRPTPLTSGALSDFSTAPSLEGRNQMSRITIRHNRQLGTLVYGTCRGMTGIGKALTEWPCNFRGSENLPDDEELGDPFWYLPHSRRRRADTYKIDAAVARLRELGHEVDVEIDDTTPAVDFAGFMEEKYDRASDRAAYQQYMARREFWTSDTIRAANQRTYDMLNGQPILVGHHSEHRHRRLLDRLWQREGKAWALYDKAKHRIDRATAAANFRAYKETQAPRSAASSASKPISAESARHWKSMATGGRITSWRSRAPRSWKNSRKSTTGGASSTRRVCMSGVRTISRWGTSSRGLTEAGTRSLGSIRSR
ncbi:DUF3560 domain-containing protein [Nocardia sp. NBC_01499]|uniref:DUF3560 domain-containing protein n=1 Tax=Nocardia sp. NBC_01499 TaxID=2903597 RepID=UPI003866B968